MTQSLLSPSSVGLDSEAAPKLTPLTPHKAQYRVFYGSIELGLANYVLPRHDTGLYRYEFTSNVSLLMLSDLRRVKSEFMVDGDKLLPYRYTHERSGTGSDYSEHTSFFKSQHNIFTIYKNEKADLAYEGTIFDPLMVQLQFRLDLSTTAVIDSYKMVKEKEVDEYKFNIVGEEILTLESGTYDTIKIEVVRDSAKRQTFFWMAPKLAYLPVRLSHFSKGSKQLDIQLDSYQFELPKQVLIEQEKGAIMMGDNQASTTETQPSH
ncbi:DUF3108 domain-containing protein [Shewanella sp. SR44-3]|uniref:DUF3108 domain-containing protein n=1 Tax=unclassified Shewanella TaxID=196818 RepID=UPI0015FD3BDD|nr:DUF3108 domain-containing protein [Shewanella sp. SR44-3]